MRKARKIIKQLVLIVVIVLAIIGLYLKNNHNFISPPQNITGSNEVFYDIVKVVDGDTFVANINGKDETIRLIGVDTPEVVDPRKSVQCFGREASDRAKALLTGRKVRLEADPTQGERDKYDRLLRYAFLADGSDFGKMMIAQGFAHEYTYNSNPYQYQAEYKKAEQDARSAKKGLWADNACRDFSIGS